MKSLLSSLYASMSLLVPPPRSRIGSPTSHERPPSPPNPQELRSHLIYWVTVVSLGAGERLGDKILTWIPLYTSIKLLLVLLLLLTKYLGTYVLFTQKLRPLFKKYRLFIDLWIQVYPQKALSQLVHLGYHLQAFYHSFIVQQLGSSSEAAAALRQTFIKISNDSNSVDTSDYSPLYSPVTEHEEK